MLVSIEQCPDCGLIHCLFYHNELSKQKLRDIWILWRSFPDMHTAIAYLTNHMGLYDRLYVSFPDGRKSIVHRESDYVCNEDATLYDLIFE